MKVLTTDQTIKRRNHHQGHFKEATVKDEEGEEKEKEHSTSSSIDIKNKSHHKKSNLPPSFFPFDLKTNSMSSSLPDITTNGNISNSSSSSSTSPLLSSLLSASSSLLPSNDDVTDSITIETFHMPNKPFISLFPPQIDEFFYSFDDYFISLFQYPLTTPFRTVSIAFALFFTTFTSIEFGLILPFVLYLTSNDPLGDVTCMCMLILSLLSQIPKRFIWRSRPWMKRRAIAIRKDKTSSFPSRAVTCGIVYGALLGISIDMNNWNWWYILLLAILFGLSASVSRIIVGAHYPSDCLVGLLSGTIVTVIGSLLYSAQILICSSCSSNECYATDTSSTITINNIRINFVLLLICTVLSSLFVLLLILPPLRFWEKSCHVLGILIPCIIFRLTFLCPNINQQYSLQLPQEKYGSLLAWTLGTIAAIGITVRTNTDN